MKGYVVATRGVCGDLRYIARKSWWNTLTTDLQAAQFCNTPEDAGELLASFCEEYPARSLRSWRVYDAVCHEDGCFTLAQRYPPQLMLPRS